MRKFNKKEFSIKPIIKPMFIISVFLTFLSFYVMREFSVLRNTNIFNKDSVTDRDFENVGRLFLLIFNLFISLLLNLVCVFFIIGFVVSIYKVLCIIISLFNRFLLYVRQSISKALTFVGRSCFSTYNRNIYLVNSTILN